MIRVLGKSAISALVFAVLLLTLGVIAACETDTAGVDSNYLQQYTTVNAPVTEATSATEDVFEELELENIKSRSTQLDGEVTGMTARGKEIKAVLEAEDESNTEITVWVGRTGDTGMGQRILGMVRERVED